MTNNNEVLNLLKNDYNFQKTFFTEIISNYTSNRKIDIFKNLELLDKEDYPSNIDNYIINNEKECIFIIVLNEYDKNTKKKKINYLWKWKLNNAANYNLYNRVFLINIDDYITIKK